MGFIYTREAADDGPPVSEHSLIILVARKDVEASNRVFEENLEQFKHAHMEPWTLEWSERFWDGQMSSDCVPLRGRHG